MPFVNDDRPLAGDIITAGDVWSITHDLVNYLSAITTYASLLHDELDISTALDAQRLQGDAAQILAAAKHARSLGVKLSAIAAASGGGR